MPHLPCQSRRGAQPGGSARTTGFAAPSRRAPVCPVFFLRVRLAPSGRVRPTAVSPRQLKIRTGLAWAGRTPFHSPSQICNSSGMKLYLRAPGGAETFPATPQRLLCRCSLLPVLEPEQKDKLHRGKLEPCTLGGYRHSGHTWDAARELMPAALLVQVLASSSLGGGKDDARALVGGRQRAFSELESVAFGVNIRAGAQGRKCGGIACSTRVAALCNSTAGSGRRTAPRERPFTGRP